MDELEQLKTEVRKRMKNDPAHDFHHIMRVYKNATTLCKKENADKKVLLSATLLHDIIKFPKSDKRSKSSSLKSAIEAKKILSKYNYTNAELQQIYLAIRDHSFSRNKTPSSLEGKILQDADRLDALGAVGIARVFAVSGAEGRPFYDPADPFCKNRKPDDKSWTIDHFFKKLLKLEKTMNTKSGKLEAKRRTKILKKYLLDFKKEI